MMINLQNIIEPYPLQGNAAQIKREIITLPGLPLVHLYSPVLSITHL